MMRAGLRLCCSCLIVVLLSVLLDDPVAARDWPSPPCDRQALPDFAPVDNPPNIEVWFGDERSAIWSPPACTGWAPRAFASMVAIAGRFRNSEGVSALAARVGAISAAIGVRYWSVSRQEWRNLFVESHALRKSDSMTPRGDFTTDEVRSGADLYLLQEENNPTSAVVYRMSIHERSTDRLVLSVANVSQARMLLIPIFEPGEQESLTFLLHDRDDIWRYYSLTRLGGGPDADVRDHASSLINRAVALYRHIARIPTDLEPPAAP